MVLPYRKGKKVSAAVLGGGDIAFPMIFTGTIVVLYGPLWALTVIPFTAFGLFVLFYQGKKGKFYPALPFVTAGCLVAWVIVKLGTL